MKKIQRHQLLKILSTMIRFDILNKVSKKPMTISQLHEQIKYPDGKPYDYKAIHKQIKKLRDYGLVTLKQDKKKQGKPVVVCLSENPPIDLNNSDVSFWWKVLIKEHK